MRRDKPGQPAGLWLWLVGLGLLLCSSLTAGAESMPVPDIAAVAVRTGNHPGFGRIVFESTEVPRYDIVRDGDHVVVHLPNAAAIAPAAPLPRNVEHLGVVPGGAEMTVAAGAHLRSSRIGRRVVIDILDPILAPSVPPPEANPVSSGGRSARPASRIIRMAVSRPPIRLPEPAPEPVPTDAAAHFEKPALPAQPPSIVAVPASAVLPEHIPDPATPVPSNASPVNLAALPLALPPGQVGFTVPFGAEIGAAALIRDGQALFVFDERRPVDMAALSADKSLAAAQVQLLAAATLIRLPLPPGMEPILSRSASGDWAVILSPEAPRRNPIRSIRVRTEAGRMLLSVAAPGKTVAVPDPEAGALLLLGTLRQPGFGVPTDRRAAEFVLLASVLGVAVQPISDRLSLKPSATGFVVAASDTVGSAKDGELTLSLTAASDIAADAASLTRRFDFPAARDEELLRRMQAHLSDVAAAPVLARGRHRVAAAQAAIALGLGTEAQSMLSIAAQEDPKAGLDAAAAGLSAVAALLAGRTAEADAIEDALLSGSDEVEYWRAVHDATQYEGSPKAAASFAATLPLVLAYPAQMRSRLLPLTLETMILGGEAAAAEPALATLAAEPTLRIATGLQKRMAGDIDGALKAFDAAAQGHDRRDQARARLLAIETRLAAHKSSPEEAATGLEAGLYAWRGDDLEFEARMLLARLRTETGNWRSALNQLRETETLYPERKIELRTQLQAAFAMALRPPAGHELPPFEFVALVDENADLMVGTTPDAELQARLADRLVALDLPRRAGPLLEKLVQGSPPGAARAGFGATLARLRLQEGDGDGATAALFASSAEGLPPSLMEQRVLLFGEASRRRGDSTGALAALAQLETPAIEEAKATLYEQARNWPAATAALLSYAGATATMAAMPDEVQARILVRLATAASQAGDSTVLGQLRGHRLSTAGQGPVADLFRLLTAVPVVQSTDLKRSRQEMAMAKTLPAGLRALEHHAGPP